jgi:hypothetical protein
LNAHACGSAIRHGFSHSPNTVENILEANCSKPQAPARRQMARDGRCRTAGNRARGLRR